MAGADAARYLPEHRSVTVTAGADQDLGPIEIRMAASGVLKGLTYNRKQVVGPGETSDPFELIATSGTHEYSVHYEYDDKKAHKTRSGFAIGASSPKIIVVPPTRKR